MVERRKVRVKVERSPLYHVTGSLDDALRSRGYETEGCMAANETTLVNCSVAFISF